jgi:hypothetical protein
VSRIPLHIRDNSEAITQWEQLKDGVPAWLHAPLHRWLEDFIDDEAPGAATLLPRMITELQLDIDSTGTLSQSIGVLSLLRHQPMRGLAVVDFILEAFSTLDMSGDPAAAAADLAGILKRGRSVWTVSKSEVDGTYQLTRTELSATQEAVGNLAKSTERPGVHLAQAWKAVAGLTPSPDTAYDQAVRAVEAAYQPVVVPRNGKARLGVMLKALTDAPAKWTYSLRVEGEPAAGVEVVAEMMRVLARANVRHGTTKQIAHSEVEALAAVHMAVALVGFVASGAFRVTESSDDARPV